jgi:hypothetical protein
MPDDPIIILIVIVFNLVQLCVKLARVVITRRQRNGDLHKDPENPGERPTWCEGKRCCEIPYLEQETKTLEKTGDQST